jgi:hypothetical protein
MAVPGYGQQPQSAPNNTLGLTSMILGIVSIPLVCCFYIGVPIGIGAIVLGFLGRQKVQQGQATNNGQALTGLITGAAAIAWAILLFILGRVLQNMDLPGVPTA